MTLNRPQLSWQEDAPHSEAFDDCYYHPEQGLEEARFVFIQSNHLPERLPKSSHFTVGETGFGTGLNFLALWQLWQTLPEPKPSLHFITTELHPMTKEDLQKAHAPWPELAPLSEALINAYPPAITGPHRRWFEGGRIQLDCLFGDAAEQLKRYQLAEGNPTIDAWFLDGFAPSKNPHMWHEGLYQAMADLSGAGTTLATFTSAGHVRRGLADAGFDVERQKGFGNKRAMTIGQFKTSIAPAIAKRKTAIVIGAGIAGISGAWRMAKQGYDVTLLEATGDICTQASGNPNCAFTPYYENEHSMKADLLGSAFASTRHIIKLLQANGHSIRHHQTGTLMLDIPERYARAKRMHTWQSKLNLPDDIRRYVDASEASEIANVNLDCGGWYYPEGGWVVMQDVARAMLDDEDDRITLHLNTRASSIEHNNGQWKVNEHQADKVIIATAHTAKEWLSDIALEPVHGQMLHFKSPKNWNNLACVLHTGHTLIPIGNGMLSWGSTFKHHLESPDILEDETTRLIDDLKSTFPDLEVGNTSITPWAGLRCTHPSHLPVIGPVPNQPEGLYMHLAHGARGLLTGLFPFAMNHCE